MKSQIQTSKVLKSQKSEFFYSMRRITLPNASKWHPTSKGDIVKHKVSSAASVSK